MGKVIVRGKAARAMAVECVKNGGTFEEAAEKTGYGVDYIRQLCTRSGVHKTVKDVAKERQAEAIRLLCGGYTPKEVAQKLNVCVSVVYGYARSEGLNVKENRKRFKKPKEKKAKPAPTQEEIKSRQDERAIRFIEEKGLPFYYSGTYTGSNGVIGMTCKKCGMTALYPAVSLRHGNNTTCVHCKAEEARRLKLEETQERERRKRLRALAEEEREREKARGIKCTQAVMKPCPVCGSLTTRPVYCSDVCAKRMANRLHETRRRIKINAQMVDKDITLEALYIRDGGKCYMCGEPCDWNDFIYMGETKVVGNGYPSIDHVLPLSKGGAHAWSNVRLACKGCNQVKNDKAIGPR